MQGMDTITYLYPLISTHEFDGLQTAKEDRNNVRISDARIMLAIYYTTHSGNVKY